MAGAAIIEAAISLPVLLVVILGAIQFALIYEAKATMNHASLQAARAGSFANADVNAIRRGLARGLAPLYSPDSSVEGVAQTVFSLNTQLATDARIRILNPTREAFADFGESVNGHRELPNDRLHTRSTSLGTRSGLNIQDANLLRVEVTYGFEMDVPLVNWFFSRILLAANRAGVTQWDAFEQQLLRRNRLPVIATSTVRMQTPARLNQAMVAKADLPAIDRIDAKSRPADDRENANDGDDAERDGQSTPGENDERSLGDGAFGFHGDHPSDDPAGGNPSTPSEGGNSANGGNANSGSPAVCGGSSDSGGIRDGFESPGNGQSSPVEPRPSPLFSSTESSSTASLPGNSLPSLAVGNPIHVATGNKYQAEIDLPALPGRLGLVFSRHYNSDAATYSGVFGAGWRHAFDARVLVDDPPGHDLRLIQADGRVISFSSVGRREDGAEWYRGLRATDGDVTIRPNKSYIWHWLDGRELEFDPSGKLTSISQRGQLVHLIYEHERLVRVTDPQRRSLTFSYYPNGRVARVAAPAGFTADYRYDAKGNLAEVVYSDGGGRVYQYEAAGLPHHLTAIAARGAAVREFGNRPQQVDIAAWTYDDKGRAISSTHPDNAGKVTLKYGDGFTDVTDAFGRMSRYDYEWIDGTARITAVHGPGCGSCGLGDVRYDYGDRFTITDIHVAHQPSVHYRYDAKGRVDQVDRTDLSGTREWLMRFQYSGSSSLPSVIEQPSVNPRGVHTTRFRFDANNNLERTTETGYSPQPAGSYSPIERTLRFEFDGQGQLLSIDGPRMDVRDITAFKYDSLGRLTEVRAPGDRVTRALKFDGAGRITTLQTRDNFTTQIAYDTSGRVLSMSEQRGNSHRTLRYELDPIGRVVGVTDSTGRQRTVQYDRANRPNDISLGGSVHEHHLYAPDDLPIRSSLVTASGHALRTLYFAYDAQRRLTETRDGDGPALRQIRYLDADDRPDLVIDPLGGETHLRYDSFGRLSEVRAQDGGETQFEFDRLQHLRSVTAPNGAHTRYRYDDFGRRLEEDSPDRGRLKYSYDAAGNLIRKVDARGMITDYRYDAANRLVRILQREGPTELRYKGTQLIAISGPNGRESYRYDDANRLVAHSRQINGHEFTTTYEYDSAGKLIAKRMPSGERLIHTYNKQGELIGLQTRRLFRSQLLLGTDDTRSPAQPITAGMLGDLRLGNGLITRTRLDLESGGTAYRGTDGVTHFSYRRDTAGRITGIDTPDQHRAYDYDATGRLTSARLPDRVLTYQYDANGNRIASTETASTNTTRSNLEYAPNSNRLMSITTSSEKDRIEYTYDASGNPLTAGPWRYEYDTNGRLRKLYHAGKLRAEYLYNAQGERVQKDVYADGKRERTFFLYERHQLIAEANEHGHITREYLYLGHHPVVMMEGGKVYWIHTDQLGAPWVVTDSDQQISWLAHYDPFGKANPDENPSRKGPSMQFNLRLPGQYVDEESETSYNLFRQYDPAIGRYATSDPIGINGGTNTFVYALANPLNLSDPLGLDVYFHERGIEDTTFLYVTWGGHTFLELTPDDPHEVMDYLRTKLGPNVKDYFALNDPLHHQGDELEGAWRSLYLSGIPDRHYDDPQARLIARENYDVDVGAVRRSTHKLNPPPFTTPTPGFCPKWSNDSIFIGNIILAQLAYEQAYPEGLFYDGLVQTPGEYNSNSFTAGILIAAGFSAADIPDPWGIQPGLDKPVPITTQVR